jgi:nucleoside-diphosphate-sugar epimerase
MRPTPGDIPTTLPAAIRNEAELDELLSRPTPALIESIKAVSSPLIILGVSGKMGPSLAMLARRVAEAAENKLDVIGVSRFNDSASRAWLEDRGVKTISCDLLDAGSVAQLPEAANVLYLAGLKFGTASNPSLTWAMNTLAPAHVCERYAHSRIVVLSTGNVYPFTEVARRGAMEYDPLTPLGEYPNAAVARERIFEFCSRRSGTRMALLRLFYAVELRYGVLGDIARKVFSGESIALANGSFNCIWQRDANELALRALALADFPPAVFNLCRPEVFSVRDVANRLGELMHRKPNFVGSETMTALIGNSAKICGALGEPGVLLDTMLRWIAHWVEANGRDLGKPTHFETRDGKY